MQSGVCKENRPMAERESAPTSSRSALPPLKLTKSKNLPPRSGSSCSNGVSEDIEQSLPTSEEMMRQVWTEMCRESVDKRRVLLLKAQLAQTERQLLVQNEALTQRHDALSTLDDTLQNVLQISRSCIGSSDARGVADVPVKRANLTKLVEVCQTTRGTIRKHMDNTLNDKYWTCALLPNSYRKAEREDGFGGINSSGSGVLREMAVAMTRGSTGAALALMNLQRVQVLEEQLSELYSLLVELQVWLGMGGSPVYCTDKFREDYTAVLEKSALQVDSLCRELLELSLLLPVYPRPAATRGSLKTVLLGTAAGAEVRRCINKEVKSSESRALLESRLRALEAEATAARDEVETLRRQLQYHERVARDVADLAEAVTRGLALGQAQLRRDFDRQVQAPLGQLLAAFDRLEAHPSPECLREYLEKCRTCVPQLREMLREPEPEDVECEPDPEQIEQMRLKLSDILRS